MLSLKLLLNAIRDFVNRRKTYCLGFVEGLEAARIGCDNAFDANDEELDKIIEELFERARDYNKYYLNGYLNGVKNYALLTRARLL